MDDVDDETGKAVRGTRRSAAVRGEIPKITRGESHRESRSKKERRSRVDQHYPSGQTAGPSQHQFESGSDKEVRIERRRSVTKSPRKQERPPSAHGTRGHSHAQLAPIHTNAHQSVNHTHFGMPTPTSRAAMPVESQPLPIRPRAITTQTYPLRPLSYNQPQVTYGGGPPLSMSAYYQPPPAVTPSYPPPSPSSNYMRYPMPTSQNDYFSPQAVARPLSSRFDPIARTQSAFGSHQPQSTYDPVPRTASAYGTREAVDNRALDVYDGGSYYDDGYNSQAESMAVKKRDRRDSIRVPSAAWSKAELDYRAMPPPTARPSILRRPVTEYPRSSSSDYTTDPQPIDTPGSYNASRTRYHDEEPRPRASSHSRHSVSYDLGPEMVTVEAANSSRRRRQSVYEQSESTATGSSGWEEKLSKAASYQENVVGGPTVPLTAETLKKQQRRQAGSRSSTKSSASRDESDYKKSATTRTTRSGSGNGNEDENVTIKVTGQARVMVGNTAVECREGGQIEISQQKNHRDNRSERSSSDFGGTHFEERRSRAERPHVGRTRMSSQTGTSYPRPTAHAHYMSNEYDYENRI